MSHFEVKIQHSEDTLIALSHMRYDLFCKRDRILHILISAACMIVGICYFSAWWGILLTAYGAFLTTSTYNGANHAAKKLARSINESGEAFPASRYVFETNVIRIYSLPANTELDKVDYSSIIKLGEDLNNYYLFTHPYGGYMLPKSELNDKTVEFRNFITKKTNLTFASRQSPFKRLMTKLAQKQN